MRSFAFLMIGMFFILFTLKLCGEISLSWWWVFTPLFGLVAYPFIVIGGVLFVVFLMLCMAFCLALIAD